MKPRTDRLYWITTIGCWLLLLAYFGMAHLANAEKVDDPYSEIATISAVCFVYTAEIGQPADYWEGFLREWLDDNVIIFSRVVSIAKANVGSASSELLTQVVKECDLLRETLEDTTIES